MDTLNYIRELMEAYTHELSNIDTEDEAEYKYRANAVRERVAIMFNAMRDANPE